MAVTLLRVQLTAGSATGPLVNLVYLHLRLDASCGTSETPLVGLYGFNGYGLRPSPHLGTCVQAELLGTWRSRMPFLHSRRTGDACDLFSYGRICIRLLGPSERRRRLATLAGSAAS